MSATNICKVFSNYIVSPKQRKPLNLFDLANLDRMAAYSLSRAGRVAPEWLMECESKHHICKTSITISHFTLPRRLINIGIPGSKTPFLVETSSLKHETCRYATLSHCWGDSLEPLQTTSSNILKHYEDIPWDTLPNTFQDAMIVSQGLGLQYLWIDSLCIIQKDKKDFEEECSRMHLIYLGCYVMIAASDSKDGSEGFLQLWDNFDKPTSSTSVANPQVSSENPAFCPQSPRFRHNEFITWTGWSEALDGTLSKRGWAYQERQLAPRILHYTRSGIMWECRQCIGAGDLRKLQPKRVISRLGNEEFLPGSQIFRLFEVNNSRLSLDDIMDRWLFIAEEYSMRNLTYIEDKLPALSGLAAAIEFLIGDKSTSTTSVYLAGLWLSDIPRQLFWCSTTPYDCDPGEQPPEDANFNFLPSWCWTSCRGSVTFHRILERLGDPPYISSAFTERDYRDARNFRPFDTFQYLSTDIKPEGLDPFGRIQGSALHIRGSFLDEDVSKITLLDKNDRRYELSCDQRKQFPLQILFDAIPHTFEGVVLRFLFLLESGEMWHCGIVLRFKDVGVFQKIGIFGIELRGSITSDDWNITSAEMTLM